MNYHLIVQYIGEVSSCNIADKLLSNAFAYLWINHFSDQKSFPLKGLMGVYVPELEADNYERATAATAQAGK